MAKVGRPTKYRPEMCERVVELGREGVSRAEIARDLDVCFETLWRWEQEHEEFRNATTRAQQLSEAWWTSQGQKGIWSRDFNANAYRLQMLNRFREGWSDQKVITGPGGGPIEHSVNVVLVEAGDDEAHDEG